MTLQPSGASWPLEEQLPTVFNTCYPIFQWRTHKGGIYQNRRPKGSGFYTSKSQPGMDGWEGGSLRKGYLYWHNNMYKHSRMVLSGKWWLLTPPHRIKGLGQDPQWHRILNITRLISHGWLLLLMRWSKEGLGVSADQGMGVLIGPDTSKCRHVGFLRLLSLSYTVVCWFFTQRHNIKKALGHDEWEESTPMS